MKLPGYDEWLDNHGNPGINEGPCPPCNGTGSIKIGAVTVFCMACGGKGSI